MKPIEEDKLIIQFLTERKPRNNILECVVIGELPLPYVEPNINAKTEIEDIENYIKNSKSSGFSCCDITTMTLGCLSILGSCFVCKNTRLINNNQYGFVIDSGKVVFLRPGWHFLGSPFMKGFVLHNIESPHIKVNNFQLIRIQQDEVGIGYDNTRLEILLPGTHCRISGSYLFQGRAKLSDDIIAGPVKVKTVQTGTVCVCYNNGIAEILTEGRYGINSNGFIVGNTLVITQQNLKFSKHKVLLEGGINMLVTGLLTYQIIDVTRLIKNVDVNLLNKYLEDVMKADLTKVFSTIHFEQISSSNFDELKKTDEKVHKTRLFIYEQIMKLITPQAEQWGIQIINFQLESIQLADQQYSSDYEYASLQIAKSKAELKAQEAQNIILKQKAETQASIETLKAETEKKVQLIKAEAEAEATIIQAEALATAILEEGEAKAQAANKMISRYGQELALLAEKTKIAEGLKIHTLVMGGGSDKSINDVYKSTYNQNKIRE